MKTESGKSLSSSHSAACGASSVSTKARIDSAKLVVLGGERPGHRARVSVGIGETSLMESPEMHPALEPIAWLLGVWRGSGKGMYPSIDDFNYEEEVRYWHGGKPVIAYSSRTWSPDDGRSLHAEMGYWRPQQDGTIEVVLAHSFGLTEVMRGSVEGTRVELASTGFGATPTAKRVEQESRVMQVHGDELHYEMSMAFGGMDLQNHLQGRLKRTA